MYTQGHSRIVGIGIHTPEKCVPSREIMEYLDSENRFGHSHRLAREGYGGKRKACLTWQLVSVRSSRICRKRCD